MESKWISRGGVTVNLRFITNIDRTGGVIIFYGESVWVDRPDGTAGWEHDKIEKFRYDSEQEAIEAEAIIRRHIGAISV